MPPPSVRDLDVTLHPLCEDDAAKEARLLKQLSDYFDELESGTISAALAAADLADDRLILYQIVGDDLIRRRGSDERFARLRAHGAKLEREFGQSPRLNLMFVDSRTTEEELRRRCKTQNLTCTVVYQ